MPACPFGGCNGGADVLQPAAEYLTVTGHKADCKLMASERKSYGGNDDEKRKNPLQNLSERRRDAEGMVQSAGRYEAEAGAALESRHPSAHEGGGALGRLLRGADPAGAG